jgi:hypothetical protein
MTKKATAFNPIMHGLLAVTIASLNSPCMAQSWNQLAPTGGPPSAREARSDSVFDPATNQLINFGGRSGSTNLNDVWSLTLGASPQWTLVNTIGGPPAPRVRHTAVYDAVNSRMIIFAGGLGSSSPCANDVWVLSNANGVNGTPTWTQLSPTGGPPAPRLVHTAVYDPTTNSMIIFGGNDCFSGFYSDVWVLSNANGLGGTPGWTQLSPGGTSPGPRGYDSAVYDPGSNRMIFFGAGPAGSSDNITWVLANANGFGGTPTWSQLAPSGTPPSIRDSHTAVYDAASNHMTVFGGNGYVNNILTEFNDVWVLSNANGLGGTPAWTELAPTGTPPPSRVLAAAVNDPATNRMIIFGGSSFLSNVQYNDTWVLSNANNLPPPTCVTPPSGMISWWPGDGNANDVVGSNSGTIVGGVSFAAGEVGQAFSFNGTIQYVDVGLLNLPSTFTVDAWINPNSFPNYPDIINKDDGGSSRSYFFQIEAAGTLAASVRNTFGGFTQYRTSLPVITAGQWQHVALTYDGGAGIGQKMKLYVNGISYPTSVIGPVCCPGAYDLGGTPESDGLSTKIGAFANGTQALNGLIDEVEVFNRVLAAPEIQAIYAAGSAGKCKPAVDTTPPNVTPNVTGTLGSNGWYTSNVNVSWKVNDPESGIASSTGCGPTTLTANTAGIMLSCSATNGVGLSTSASVTIKIDMSPPNPPAASVNPAPNGAGWNNSATTVSFLAMGDNGPSGVALCTSPINFASETAGTTVGGFCSDFAGNTSATAFVTVRIDETAPVVSNVLATPDPVAVNNSLTLTATVTDPGIVVSGVASASYTINGGAPVAMQAADGDFGQASENVTAVIPAFSTDGVYNLCVTGTDSGGNASIPSCIPLPVYNPTAGFVTGGGSIFSPAGNDLVNASAAGQATFGFVSKYLKGATTPSGNLEFHFQAGNLHFQSTSMDWLVVTGEPRAQFHGRGTFDGTNVCQFAVDAWDNSFPSTNGPVDAFGIKIYSCNSGGDSNGNRYSTGATPLSGGSIIIHK